MIKVYLDWNVFSQIKNGNHLELKEIVLSNKKMLIPFSTSHIGDIFSSYKETDTQRRLIESDLNFISELTKDMCLVNTGNDVVLDIYSPKELFRQRVDEKDLLNDISLDGLINALGQDDTTKHIGKLLVDLLKSIPLGEEFRRAFEDPESAEQMDKIFPGLKENPTMEGFFKSFNEMNHNLNESDGYGDLRKIIQEGLAINRDKIYSSDDPYEMIEKKYEKLGISLDRYTGSQKSGPEWFDLMYPSGEVALIAYR